MSRPARANPTLSLRWSIEVDPSWDRITSSEASSNSSSSASHSSSSDAARPSSSTLTSYSGSCWARTNSETVAISFSVTHAPWIRVGFETFEGRNSMSPWPTSFSAPPMSRITRESACDAVMNAIRDGMFALIRPVTTSTDGRCVATTRWMPTARAICAMRQIASSTSRGATIIRSASSSMTTTSYGTWPNCSS